MNSKLKMFVVGLVVGLSLTAGVTYAWSSVWNGTAWITNGGVIDAQKIAENFEYLKTQVVQGGMWVLNGTSAYYNGGNVGIGTANPGAKLHVVGGQTVLDKLRFTGVGGNSGQSVDWYSIYQEAGAWVSPYPDLVIQNHTGLKYNAYAGYGGHQFFTGWDGSSITGLRLQITDKVYVPSGTELCLGTDCRTSWPPADTSYAWYDLGLKSTAYSFTNTYGKVIEVQVYGGNYCLSRGNRSCHPCELTLKVGSVTVSRNEQMRDEDVFTCSVSASVQPNATVSITSRSVYGNGQFYVKVFR